MFSDLIPALRRPAGRASRGAVIATLVVVGLTGASAGGAANAPGSQAADELAMRCELRNPGPFKACDIDVPVGEAATL